MTDLSASANLAGRIGMSGAVRKATEKQTAAPSKQAPKPINLENGGVDERGDSDDKMSNDTSLSHLERAK